MSQEAHRISSWFETHRFDMSGNGNWFLGGEPNTICVDSAENASIKVLIARLSAYHDVARGITHSFLYQLAASVKNSFVDLAFYPGEKDEKLMVEHNIPIWTGTTSKLPPMEFDLVAISNSVLQELVNLPAALHFSGIPLSRQDREKSGAPLVILGGSNSYNLSIIHGNSGDSLVDGVLIGDGEKTFPLIIEIVRECRGLARAEVLKQLREIVPGFYDPACYEQHFSNGGELTGIEASMDAPFPVKASRAACLGPSVEFSGGPILYDEDSAGASHLIVTAGCPSFCSFCKESWEQKPYRERPLEDLVENAAELKARMGLSEVALMSFNATTYTNIFQVVEKLDSFFDRVSIKSQRFDTVVIAPGLLDLQFESGKRSYTCAMEGISERLRILLQKNLSEKTILQGFSELIRRSMRQLKVFLILTGYEDESDLEDFTDFLHNLKRLLKEKSCTAAIMFSFACLFRPPHTPMQFAGPRMSLGKMNAMLERLVALIKNFGYDARISAGPTDAIFSEYLAYADRRHSPILIEASIEKGFRYRGDIHHSLCRFWQKALEKYSLKPLCDQEKTLETNFPWDDISTGISKQFLFENYSLLLSGQQKNSCISEPWGTGICSGCGACSTPSQVEVLNAVGPGINKVFKLPVRGKMNQCFIWFQVPEKWSFCGKKFLMAALARKLMLENPKLVRSFMRVVRIVPEFFAHGNAIAEVEFREPVDQLNVSPNDDIRDVRIVKMLKQKQLSEKDFWPIQIEYSCMDAISDISRKMDAILSKYRLKNHKQRKSEFLNWEISKGQAKKTGIENISLNENSGQIRLQLCRMPEIFLLNLLTEKSSLRVVNIADFS